MRVSFCRLCSAIEVVCRWIETLYRRLSKSGCRASKYRTDCLARHESDAAADQYGREPSTAIHILVEKELGRHGITHEGEGSRCRGYEADIRIAHRKEQREEAEGHADNAKQKSKAAYHGAYGSSHAVFRPDDVQIADFTHC